MPITRDAEFPGDIAQLVQAFNHCADGHNMNVVIEAAGNMFSAAIHNYASMAGMSDEEAMDFASNACKGVFGIVEMNWKRARKATDVEVKAS